MPNEISDNINKTILEAKNKGAISSKDISDGHHTFGDLYKHRIALFCVVCNSYPELSWKSKKHFNEEEDPMFNGNFIAGINTPFGQVAYHIKFENWDEFEITELERAPMYDGYNDKEALVRLKSLTKNRKFNKTK